MQSKLVVGHVVLDSSAREWWDVLDTGDGIYVADPKVDLTRLYGESWFTEA